MLLKVIQNNISETLFLQVPSGGDVTRLGPGSRAGGGSWSVTQSVYGSHPACHCSVGRR